MIFHEKTGIFSDDHGNHVAFTGSANETAGGLVENFESIKVFRSWQDHEGRVMEEIANFESLWSDSTPGLRSWNSPRQVARSWSAFVIQIGRRPASMAARCGSPGPSGSSWS